MRHVIITIDTITGNYDECWGLKYLAEDISERTGINIDDIEIEEIPEEEGGEE